MPGLQLPWDNLTRQSLFESTSHLESSDDSFESTSHLESSDDSVQDTDEAWTQLNDHLENFLRSPDDIWGQVFRDLGMQQRPSQQPTSLADAVPAPGGSQMPPADGPRSSQLEAPKPKLDAERSTFGNDGTRLILGVMEPGSTAETKIPLDLRNPVHLCLVQSLVVQAEGKPTASYDIQDQAPVGTPKVWMSVCEQDCPRVLSDRVSASPPTLCSAWRSSVCRGVRAGFPTGPHRIFLQSPRRGL